MELGIQGNLEITCHDPPRCLEEKFSIAFQDRFFASRFLRKLAGKKTTTGRGGRARRIFWRIHDLIISCND